MRELGTPAKETKTMRPHTKGLLITATGSLVFTPDGLLIRLADVEPFTYAAIRGLMIAGGLSVILLALRGGAFWPSLRRIGRWGLLAALFNGLGGISFIFAFAHTSVANVLLYIAAEPFLVAIIARWLIGERISRALFLAMLGGFVGIGIVVWGGIDQPTIIGDGAALLTALLFAVYFAILRKRRDIDMVPGVVIAGLINCAFAIPFMFLLGQGLQPLQQMDSGTWGWTLLNGLLLPVGTALTAIGPRYLPAAEVSLLILLEVVLGPLAVWAGVGEVPPDTTLLGGALVLGSLLAHTLWTLRRPRKLSPASVEPAVP